MSTTPVVLIPVQRYNSLERKRIYSVPKVGPPSTLKNIKMIPQIPSVDSIFDNFLVNTSKSPLHLCLEEMVKSLLKSTNAQCWIFTDKVMNSPSLGKTTTINNSILCFSFRTNQITFVGNPQTHDCYDREVDGDAPIVYVPFADMVGKVLFVVKVGIINLSHDDRSRLEQITFKFKKVSHLILPLINQAQNSSQLNEFQEFLDEIELKFGLRLAQLFKKHGICELYTFKNGDFLPLGGKQINSVINDIGFAKDSLINEKISVIDNVLNAEGYNELYDGTDPEAAASIPFQFKKQVVSLVLRRKKVFTQAEINEILSYHKKLAKLLNDQILIQCHDASIQTESSFFNQNANDSTSDNHDKRKIETIAKNSEVIIKTELSTILLKLLSFTESISYNLSIENLIEISSSEIKKIFNADSSALLVVSGNELIAPFGKRFKVDDGIAGHVISEKLFMNTLNAKVHPKFDNVVDTLGKRQNTDNYVIQMMAVPIISISGSVLGCIEVIKYVPQETLNSENEEFAFFGDNEEKVLKALSVLISVHILNALIFSTAISLGKTLGSSCTMKNPLDRLTQMITDTFKAKRVTLYSYVKSQNKFELIKNSGLSAGNVSIFVRDATNTKRTIIFNGKDIHSFQNGLDKTLESTRSNICSGHSDIIKTIFSTLEESIECNSGNSKKTSLSMLKSIQSLNSIERIDVNDFIIAFPILSKDDSVLGAVEFVTPEQLFDEDLTLIELFALNLAAIIENINEKCRSELTLKEYLSTDEERKSNRPPAKLLIDQKKSYEISLQNFDVFQYDDINGIRIIFILFSNFDLQKKFSISNETLFNFSYNIMNTFLKVPTFSWHHALDSFQFAMSLLSKLEKSPIDVLATAVSCLCRNLGRQESEILKNEEYANNILNENYNAYEVICCEKVVSIISRDECNIFKCFLENEVKSLWELVFELIISTNLYKKLDTNDKLYDLKLISRCSIFAPAARSNKSCIRDKEYIDEILYRTVNIQEFPDIVFNGKNQQRQLLNKEKSMPILYSGVVVPLFENLNELSNVFNDILQVVQRNSSVLYK
ncbi:hypothetical protein TRFO_05542 [Tritrichomonas foetus]|uniref:PDEase domain-containing protein n=1 Tax=Tritrichomonas foetus TaxID=1144522 RepID=A0A1J4K655_9EUKA|nr:hypothetical protein TRFO_05542 [Tritrichomonas foetus]|eukprot:OHT06360.1 hypothetical protein TRFO_05542 [Tritrichomonas foetus]